MIPIIGSSKLQGISPLSRHTGPSLQDQWALSHGNGFGNLGPLANVKPSFGWPFVTGVGRLTVYKKEGSLTLLAACCATNKKRQSNIYSPHVSSPDSFGLASFNHWIYPAWFLDAQLVRLQIGGENLGKECKNSYEKDLIHWWSLVLGPFGNIEMPVFLMEQHHTYRELFKPSKMSFIYGNLLVPKGLLF